MTIIRNKEKGTKREPGREKCTFLNFDQSYLRASEPKMCSTTKKARYLGGPVFQQAFSYLCSAWSPTLEQRTTLDVRTRLCRLFHLL